MSGFGTGSFGGAAFAAGAADYSVITVEISDGFAVATLLASQLAAQAAVSDNLAMVEALDPEHYRHLLDGFNAADALTYQWGPKVRDTVTFNAAAVATARFLQLVEDNVAFADAVAVTWEMAVADSFNVQASPIENLRKLAIALDTLRLTDSAIGNMQAAVAVVAGFAMAASATRVHDEDVLDQVELTVNAVAIAELMQLVNDGFVLADTATPTARITALISDSLGLSDALVSQLTAYQVVRDGFNLAVTVRVGDEVYYAYVLHTDPVDRAGTRPVTEYRNYPFNSFALSPNGKQYAAGAGGIYLLEGDDDAGTAIDAYFRTGLERFGSPNRKRAPELFLVLRARDQAVFVKVVHVDPTTGTKIEDWYDLEPRAVAGTDLTQSQVRLQQGIQSVSWQLELRNRDGADFDVRELRFYPLHLDRS